jgi:hypothetical protein
MDLEGRGSLLWDQATVCQFLTFSSLKLSVPTCAALGCIIACMPAGSRQFTGRMPGCSRRRECVCAHNTGGRASDTMNNIDITHNVVRDQKSSLRWRRV